MKQEDLYDAVVQVMNAMGELVSKGTAVTGKIVMVESATIGNETLYRFLMHDYRDGKVYKIPFTPDTPICMMGSPPIEHPDRPLSGTMYKNGDDPETYAIIELPRGAYAEMAEDFYNFLISGELPEIMPLIP